VVGDVCGTGPAAAGITAFARHSLAEAVWHGDHPAAALKNLNRSMRYRYDGQFCTVCYATLQPSTQGARLTVVCGGHPLPLLVRPDGTVRACGEHGTLIGLFEDVRFSPVTTELGPGDMVVFYTYGITDLRPPHTLDDDDLATLLQTVRRECVDAETMAAGIEAALGQLLAFDKRNDDIALVVVEITGASRGTT
jgi:serine phosphatase RsbU (regulator of sigma subunit)